jgi:hypothetical protein
MADGVEAEVLALLTREFEDKHYVIEAPRV